MMSYKLKKIQGVKMYAVSSQLQNALSQHLPHFANSWLCHKKIKVLLKDRILGVKEAYTIETVIFITVTNSLYLDL